LKQQLLRAGVDPGFWMPAQGSTTAQNVDWLFNVILGISIFFFLLIVVLVTFFVIRYRRRRGAVPEKSASHHTALELTWSIIPLLLVIVIFFLGFRGYLDMATPPQNAYEVQVTAQKWNWQFTYPNGHTDAALHVPVNTPVRLVLSSTDVIHSLFIPAFRIKKDAVPGRYTKAWFQATTAGTYPIYCAEYCGTLLSDMLADCIVHEPGGFEKWMAEAADFIGRMPPADAGARLVKARGCLSCHTVDGRAGIGPSFKGLFGTEAVLTNGQRALVDENYIRKSILDPASEVVAGFDPVMPTYQGRMKDKEISVIIEYMKTLK